MEKAPLTRKATSRWRQTVICAALLGAALIGLTLSATPMRVYTLYTAAPDLLPTQQLYSFPSLKATPQLSVAQCHLLQLARKLVNRQPIEVGLIGGSITVGGEYGEQLLAYLNTHYPPLDEHGNATLHTLSNRGIRGIGSHTYSLCLDDFYPDALPDLLLVDFTVNDHNSFMNSENDGGRSTHAEAQSEALNLTPASNVERIARRVLAHSRPINTSTLHKATNQLQCSMANPTVDSTAMMLLYFTRLNLLDVEAEHKTVAVHYDIPDASFHDTVEHWPQARAGDEQNSIDVKKLYVPDELHPSPYGHYIVQTQLIAHIRHAVERVQHDNKLWCQMCGHANQAISTFGNAATLSTSSLPPPMFPGNVHSEFACNLGETMPSNDHMGDKASDFGAPNRRNFTVAYNTGGWAYYDETTNQRKDKIKKGWVSTEPGSLISIAVPELQHTLILSYLRSYEHVGVTELFVTAGAYDESTMSAYRDDTQHIRSTSMVVDALFTAWGASTYELQVYDNAHSVLERCKSHSLVPHMNVRLLDARQISNASDVGPRINKFKFIGYFAN